MSIEFKRTGRMVPFLDISIGSPFYAHDRMWIRTSYEAATELRSTNESRTTQSSISVCNFNIDECDREIEAVDMVVDGVPDEYSTNGEYRARARITTAYVLR